ncbi:MAG TPA: XRE family transcriptional regulator [Candidatus Polarisedimenticolia bacterium]|jgi:transcriptional regulator with XRE-family HTH domain|nr:XRE family transcriptional regulator [Candidatus Polarisedimenticolia bacterium]
MLSKTLEEGLSRYALGEKLRALRLRKKIGLVDLGRHTGLSPALLSKIENGKLFPTLPTLLRIALVYSVGLEHFFAEKERGPVRAIVRRKERMRFPDSPDARHVNYHFESLDFPAKDRRLDAYLAEFEAVEPEKVRRHDHPGIELLYVMSGVLEVRIGKEEHRLEQGDAMSFDASVAHGYRKLGKKRCTAIVVSAP